MHLTAKLIIACFGVLLEYFYGVLNSEAPQSVNDMQTVFLIYSVDALVDYLCMYVLRHIVYAIRQAISQFLDESVIP